MEQIVVLALLYQLFTAVIVLFGLKARKDSGADVRHGGVVSVIGGYLPFALGVAGLWIYC